MAVIHPRCENDQSKKSESLDKAGITEQRFIELYGNQELSGAQINQYLYTGAKGEKGLIARFDPRTTRENNKIGSKGVSRSDNTGTSEVASSDDKLYSPEPVDAEREYAEDLEVGGSVRI